MDSEEFHRLHPFKQATHSHHRFMEIFPFSDLSGKVGRIMMNLILVRAGYMPLVIHSMDRQTYYDALRLNATQFGNVLMQSMDNALDNAFKFFVPGWNDMSRKRVASGEEPTLRHLHRLDHAVADLVAEPARIPGTGLL